MAKNFPKDIETSVFGSHGIAVRGAEGLG